MKKLQRFRTGAMALALLAMLFGVCLAAEQSVVMVNLTQPIEANKSNTATAKFSELTPDAMKYGMADAYITGQVEYSLQPDKTIRSNIKWTAIAIENAGKKVTEGLDQILSSAFRVPQSSPRAEPGTKLKAVGDVDALAVSLGKLKAQLDAQSTPVQKETNTTKNQAQTVSPTVQAQDSNQDKYLSDSSNPFNTVVESGTKTSYVACDDYFVDIANMKAVKQYKPIYVKDGVQTGEGICAPNYAESVAIQRKDGDCTYRFDFQNSTAAKQEQLYYLNSASEILVGGCRDSDTTYPLFESRTGCSVTMDLANAKAFPTSKLAFNVGNMEMNATECRAVAGTTGIDLQEEACDPMWEHDFVNNVSYLVTRIYYIDDVTGQKVYASQCGRSTKVSYPHVQDTTDCGWIMDDEKMLAFQQGKTIIKTGSLAGDVEIQGCHTIATVNYTYIGLEKKIGTYGPGAGSFTVPSGVSSVHWLLSAGGQSSANECVGAGVFMAPGKVGQSTVKYNFPVAPGATFTYNVGGPLLSSPTSSTLVYAEDGKPNQNWTMINPGTPMTIGVLTCAASTGCTGNCGASVSSLAESNGLNGLIVTGYFGLNTVEDNPHAGASGPAMYDGGIQRTTGGIGFGASAAGPYNMTYSGWSGGGSGTPGAFLIEYNVQKYMRPDGTTYTRN